MLFIRSGVLRLPLTCWYTQLKWQKVIFKYGFTHKGQPYGWYKKELYRLPFNKKLRWYGLKKLNTIKISNLIGYRVSKDKLSLQQLKYMTKQIDFKIDILIHSGLPF